VPEMNVEDAANMLAGSILTALTLIVFIIAIIVINNILHKYWKPVRIFTADSWHINPPARFIEQPEAVVEPVAVKSELKNERTN
jgi:hypothetical protein